MDFGRSFIVTSKSLKKRNLLAKGYRNGFIRVATIDQKREMSQTNASSFIYKRRYLI
jgi:hypothetical protein